MISRVNGCVGERCCLLVLNRTYAEPVTPLGRQRGSAAAVRRGVDGTETEVDEEVDRPSDVLGPFVTGG